MKNKNEGAPSKNGLLIKCEGCGTTTLFKMLKSDGRFPCKYCGCERVFRDVDKLKKMMSEGKNKI